MPASGDPTTTHSDSIPPRNAASLRALTASVTSNDEPWWTSEGIVFPTGEKHHVPAPVPPGAASREMPPVQLSRLGSGSFHRQACYRRPGLPGGSIDPP